MTKVKILTNLLAAIMFSAAIFNLAISSAYAEDLKEIIQQAQDGQQAAALDRINAYIFSNPKDVQAMFVRGVILAELGKKDEAIKAFTELTEKYPTLPEPYNNLAVLYADQGQYDKARKALETAIKTHPSYATAHENLGDLYARMASEAYDKALQLDNSNARAQSKLALIKDLVGPANKPITVASNKAAADTAKADVKSPAASAPMPIRPADTKPIKTADIKPVEPAKPPAAMATEPIGEAKPKDAAQANDASSSKDDIEKAIKVWAQAWSDKNVDKYLDSYAKSFTPPDGLSRGDWESLRKERVSKPANITVSVSELKIDMESSTAAKASFRQSYRAGGSPMRTPKTLIMKKVDGKWLINAENAGK